MPTVISISKPFRISPPASVPLGTSQDFQQTAEQLRGGMTYRAYRAKCAEKVLSISTFEMPDGKIEQFLVSVGN